MKKKKISLRSLFFNNRFVFFFSIFAAIVIWLIVAFQFSPEDTRVITDIPVKIDLSNSVNSFDLEIFGQDKFTVDVTIVGKRYVIAESVLNRDDIVVSAKTNYVNSAGEHTLKIDVQKKNTNADFEITEVSQENIDVYFDVYKELEYSLEAELVETANSAVPEGYYRDTPVLSSNTITISGPTTEIDKIERVLARVVLKETLAATGTFVAEIVPLSEFGAIPSHLSINNENAEITMTVPVYKKAELMTTLTFRNSPAFYITNPINYTINPESAMFAVSEELLENMTAASVGTLDFSRINVGNNVYIFESSGVINAKVLDDIESFRVTINVEDMESKRVTVPFANIAALNVPAGYTATIKSTGISSAKVIGPKADIEELEGSNVFADVDLSKIEAAEGSVDVSARLYVKERDTCWVYGDYTVKVELKVSGNQQ